MKSIMIIGCGGIAPAHIEGYLHSGEDVKIAWLADNNLERARELIKRYDLTGAEAIADYRDGLAAADIVSVCTPPAMHRDAAMEAIRHHCHVLLEKPMAPTLAECDEILEAARENGCILSVVVQSRFITSIRNIVDMVKSGDYGRALLTEVHSTWYRGESYYDLKWRGRWTEEGGGCTLNHSIHHIDLLLWVKGLPQTVTAFMTNLNHHNSEEEDYSCAMLTYPDGTLVQLTSSLVSHGDSQTLTFQMEKGALTIPYGVLVSKPRDNGFPEDNDGMRAAMEQDYASRPPLAAENHDGQVRNFLRCILHDEPLIATGADGRNCIELILGIYKSAITHQPVTLPLMPDDPFYRADWRATAPHFHEKSRDVAAFADTTITSFKNKF